jgi:hypothetical protein
LFVLDHYRVGAQNSTRAEAKSPLITAGAGLAAQALRAD